MGELRVVEQVPRETDYVELLGLGCFRYTLAKAVAIADDLGYKIDKLGLKNYPGWEIYGSLLAAGLLIMQAIEFEYCRIYHSCEEDNVCWGE